MCPASACDACGAWHRSGPAKASGPGPLKDQGRLSAASARSHIMYFLSQGAQSCSPTKRALQINEFWSMGLRPYGTSVTA